MSQEPLQKKSKPTGPGNSEPKTDAIDGWEKLLDKPLSERCLSLVEMLGLLALVENQKQQQDLASGMDRRYPDKLMSYTGSVSPQDSPGRPGKHGKR